MSRSARAHEKGLPANLFLQKNHECSVSLKCKPRSIDSMKIRLLAAFAANDDAVAEQSLHLVYMWQPGRGPSIKYVTLFCSNFDSPPPARNCHTFSDSFPLESDVLYRRPLRSIP